MRGHQRSIRIRFPIDHRPSEINDLAPEMVCPAFRRPGGGRDPFTKLDPGLGG
jgi:hypothetical protein